MLQHTQSSIAADKIRGLAKPARLALRMPENQDGEKRNNALHNIANGLMAQKDDILTANQKDMEAGRQKPLSDAMLDRLYLDKKRIAAMAQGVREIAKLDYPVGRILDEWQRPNGLTIQRVATPLGLIGVIFESRPNVTIDAAALALKSGNAVLLRGGSDSIHSSIAMGNIMQSALRESGLDAALVQVIEERDRAMVGAMLAAYGLMDVIVPRGGKSLTERVMQEAKVPVLAHLEGVVHIYVHQDADPKKAVDIIVNAKMRRTGICGAMECLVMDQTLVNDLLPQIAQALHEKGCELRGDATAMLASPLIKPATPDDYGKEFLNPILAIRCVDGAKEAIEFIQTHSSGHTDAIITENQAVADDFLRVIDSAIVMHNASTQFADGGEFGMGAEIGIATGRMHARGPIGVEQLCCFQYHVRGQGQLRPL